MLDYDRGAYTEFTLASDRELAARPKKVSEKEAGVIGVAALTAWQGLFAHGRLRKGQRVLIHGAAGGVGHFAVQFAKFRGATVIATASTRDLPWVRELGADDVIDFETQRFEEHTGEIDLVLDLVSGDVQRRSWDVLRPSGGAIVSTLSQPAQDKAARHSARGMRMVVTASSGQLAQIAKLVAAGRVKVRIDRVFPLRKAAEAHRFLARGHVRGKIALEATPSRGRLGRLEDIEDSAKRLAVLVNEALAGAPPAY
jgi:NADPH:quinone reductase-like Zn-dependent oxidoreductase